MFLSIQILTRTNNFSLSSIYVQKGKVDSALKLIYDEEFEKAKIHLDQTVVHQESKNWAKTYFVLGKYYSELCLFKSDSYWEISYKCGDLLEKAFQNYQKAMSLKDTWNEIEDSMDLEIMNLYNHLYTCAKQKFYNGNIS